MVRLKGNHMKKISIVVAVYNVESYLERCIQSILRQTYQNIEIILINDGSKDRSGEICEEYKKRDDRIVYIAQENQGLAQARNVGIANSTGEYMMFVDSDDWLEPDYCSGSCKDLEETNSDIVVFGYNMVQEDYTIMRRVCADSMCMVDSHGALELLIQNKIQNYAWNKIYKTYLFDTVSFPAGMVWEDIGTTYLLFDKAQKITITNRTLYNYLQRSGSITNAPISLKSLADIFKLRYEQALYLKETYPDIYEQAIELVADSALELCDRCINCKENQYIKETKLCAKKFLDSNQEEIYRVKKNKVSRKMRLYYENYHSFEVLFRVLNKKRSLAKRLIQMTTPFTSVAKRAKRKLGEIKQTRKFKKNDMLYEKFSNVRKCYFIGSPDHNNLGDVAIAVSTNDFLQSLLYGWSIIDITECEYWKVKYSIVRSITQNDMIVLAGGGNIGDEYSYIEKIRRDVMKSFKHNFICVFPQTMYFHNTLQGKKELRKTKRIYRAHNNLLLLAREKTTYETMCQLFGSGNVHLLPDIVLKLKVKQYQEDRKGCLLCLRNDREQVVTSRQREQLRSICIKLIQDVKETDTCLPQPCERNVREEKVEQKLLQFAQVEIVITDRLHGMVFAALTHTPCIVLPNYNFKVRGVYEWVKELNYIQFLDSFDGFESTMKRLLNIKEKTKFPSQKIAKEYQWLSNRIVATISD